MFIRHVARWAAPPAALAGVVLASPVVDWPLLLPPIAVNLALCWLFGRTLARGRVPLIARFAMMERGPLNAELASYTRTLTWLWSLLFAGAAVASLVLALSGGRDAWSWFTNFLVPLLVAGLFFGEFAYRRLRFRAYSHQPLLEQLRNMRRANLLER